MINDLLPPLHIGKEASVPSLRVSTWRRPGGQPSLMINDLPTPGGVGEAPLRSGGATGASAITAPASAGSASADKERNNDMSLTYSEWKNPYSVATLFVCASSRVCFLCLTKKARSDLAADAPTPQPAL